MNRHFVYAQGKGLEDDEGGPLYSHSVATRFLRYLSPYRRLTALTVITMLISSGAQVATPWIVGYAIDTIITRQDLEGLTFITLLFLGTISINYVTQYAHLALMAHISQGVLYAIRTDMFDHLQRLSLTFFSRFEVGRIMSRVQNDVQQLQEFLSIMIIGFADLLSLVGIVVVLFIMNVKLAAITLTVLPVLMIVLLVWQRYARHSFDRVRRAIAVVNGALQENISGVRVVQSLTREDVNFRRFDRLNHDHLDANLQASRLSSSLMPAAELLMAVGLALVVVFGGAMVLEGSLAIGALVAFAIYVQRFFDPIRNLTMQYTQLQRAMVSGTRIFQLMDIQPDIVDARDAVELPKLRGEVRFDHVNFHYIPGSPVLRDVNLQVRPGQSVALVGPTGAGKTSMTALVARFYDVIDGAVLVDGRDVRQVKRESLASQVSMVLQEPFLFSASVTENIRYNRVHATSEEIELASRAVGAHDFISELEDGYETILQERGANLSIGQRQLISFARALVADPRILFLDEATANVDSATEAQIQEALKTLLRGRTSFIIAHRLSTIRNADLVVVLDEGCIVESGSHTQLMAKGGLYAHLYEANFGVAPT